MVFKVTIADIKDILKIIGEFEIEFIQAEKFIFTINLDKNESLSYSIISLYNWGSDITLNLNRFFKIF